MSEPTTQLSASTFRAARDRCIDVNAGRIGAANKNCALHFTGTFDRRISTAPDRRQFRSVEIDRPLRRNRSTGRRSGDVVKYADLPVKPQPIQPQPIKVVDRRAPGPNGRRVTGQRRSGKQDRRVINTWGAPARRRILRGRRAGDVSYNKLPRATPPAVKAPAPKPTLREAVADLMLPIRREQVLDLLREYGVEDA